MDYHDPAESHTRDIYDDAANGYDRFLGILERMALARLRCALIPRASGRILELAVGTGVNLPLYPPGACVVGLDISSEMLAWARRRRIEACAGLIQADAARLPLGDGQFDTVVSTLLYCSLDEPFQALSEIRRVLRPDGRLIMLEHVRGSPPFMALLTELVNIPWHAATRSCRLTRQPDHDLPKTGFRILSEERHMLSLFQTIVAAREE